MVFGATGAEHVEIFGLEVSATFLEHGVKCVHQVIAEREILQKNCRNLTNKHRTNLRGVYLLYSFVY